MFTWRYPVRCVVVTSKTSRLFERCGMLSRFVFRKQLNQNKLQAHCFTFVVSLPSKISFEIDLKCIYKSPEEDNVTSDCSFWLENVCFALPNLSPIPSVLSQTCLAYMLLTSPTWRLKWTSWRSFAILEMPGQKCRNILVFIK